MDVLKSLYLVSTLQALAIVDSLYIVDVLKSLYVVNTLTLKNFLSFVSLLQILCICLLQILCISLLQILCITLTLKYFLSFLLSILFLRHLCTGAVLLTCF